MTLPSTYHPDQSSILIILGYTACGPGSGIIAAECVVRAYWRTDRIPAYTKIIWLASPVLSLEA